MSDRPEPEPLNLVKKVIILNGPPGVGKDLAANAICHYMKKNAAYLDPQHEKFSKQMKEGVHALFGMPETTEYIDVNLLKDKPHSDLLGHTPREEYIAIFRYLEQRFGSDILGRLMEHKLRRDYKRGLHVFSDGGRLGDVCPVIEYVGQRKTLLIEVHADGKTFEGDIRSHIGTELQGLYPKLQVHKVVNTFSDDPLDKLLFRSMCIGLAKKFLGVEDKETGT